MSKNYLGIDNFGLIFAVLLAKGIGLPRKWFSSHQMCPILFFEHLFSKFHEKNWGLVSNHSQKMTKNAYFYTNQLLNWSLISILWAQKNSSTLDDFKNVFWLLKSSSERTKLCVKIWFVVALSVVVPCITRVKTPLSQSIIFSRAENDKQPCLM